MVGSADLFVSKWRFTFFGCLWHRKGEQEWISLPAREWTDAEGKRVFTALGKSSSQEDTRRFSAAAIAAIKLIAGEMPAPQKTPSRRRAGFSAPPRRAGSDAAVPDDSVADLWQPETEIMP